MIKQKKVKVKKKIKRKIKPNNQLKFQEENEISLKK